MKIKRMFLCGIAAMAMATAGSAYIEREFHLAEIVDQATNIVVMRVKSVDEQAGKIIYEIEPNGNLKGKAPFRIAQDYLYAPSGIQAQARKIAKLVKPGDLSILFYQSDGYSFSAERHVAGLWYQTHASLQGDPDKMWWPFQHEEVYLDRTFCGKTEDLLKILPAFMKGETVEITRVFSKTDKSLCRARISNRGDGIPDTLQFMPVMAKEIAKGQQFGTRVFLPGTSGPGRGATWVDYNADGRLDAYLCNADGSNLFRQNKDGSWEMVTKDVGLGAGSAVGVWADYSGSGRPSLLISSSPPRLFTNLPNGRFRDDGAVYLPKLARYNIGGVAWTDYNCDGWPDILIANAQYGIHLFENLGSGTERFRDVSVNLGLGEKAGASGNFITVADANRDDTLDFLYNSANGVLYTNQPGKSFHVDGEVGLKFETNPRVGVAWGDFNNDGHPDLFVPQDGRSRLYANDGKGKFTDITEKSGELAKHTTDRSTCAAWGDFNNDGKLDLFIGNLGQPNRLYINNGDGTFSAKTSELGLGDSTYDTTSAVAADFDHNGTLDLLTSNLSQQGIIFVNNIQDTPHTGITIRFAGGNSIGASVVAQDEKGKILASRQVTGSNGYGSQDPLEIHMALPKGKIKLQWRGSMGKSQQKTISVARPEIITLDLPKPSIEIKFRGRGLKQ